MDNSLKRMLGLTDEGKRTYRFVSGEVTRDEFQYCQSLDALLFGKDGYIETLGPTWEMIHDPRFAIIEDAFIINRRAVFGGDAMVGKQYISSDGTFTSTIADLEQYSETLGEGRYFYYVISHPDESCPLRNWYISRLFPDMVKYPTGDTCGCDLNKYINELQPRNVKDAPDDMVWDIIRQECPNYFNREGKPNGVAQRLFDLFRSDLLGLIADYAVTPLSNVYIELDTGDVLDTEELQTRGVVPHVFLEVDILEKALTQRAVLRATAAKILRQTGFHKVLKEELGDGPTLTDAERDHILRLVYNPPQYGALVIDPSTNWFGFLHVVSGLVLNYVKSIKADGRSVEERQAEQLSTASTKAHNTFDKLISGELQPINQYTEPEVDVQLDPHATIMEAVLKNPLKQELFMLWAEAERLSGHENQDNELRMKMNKLYSILTPVFTDPDFVVEEEQYNNYMDEAANLGMFDHATTQVEEGLTTEDLAHIENTVYEDDVDAEVAQEN
jgi:hypothetical protein